IVTAQCRKDEGELFAGHDPALADRPLTCRDTCFIDQQTNFTRIAEIEHRGHKCQARDLLFTARGEYTRGAAEHRPTDAEAEGTQLVDARDCERRINGLEDAELQIIIPREMTVFGGDIPPRYHEDRVTLLDGIANKRISWLQVE